MVNKEIKIFGVMLLLAMFILAMVIVINNLTQPEIITDKQVAPGEVINIPSQQLQWNNVQLEDSTVYNESANTCIANKLGMKVVVTPCVVHSALPVDLTQYVSFNWTGTSAHNISAMFIYEGQLDSAKMYVQENASYQYRNGEYIDQQVNNFLVKGVQSTVSLGTPTRCDVGSLHNTQSYNVTFAGNVYPKTQIYCFSSVTVVNSTAFRISGNNSVLNNTIYTGYKIDYTNDISHRIKDISDNIPSQLRKNFTFYQVSNVKFNTGEQINTKWVYTPNNNSLTGKWHILLYDATANTVFSAIQFNKYLYIDPYWTPINPTGYWKFNETTGNASDTTGGQNLTNGFGTYAAGKLGNAVTCTAGFNCLQTSNSTPFQLGQFNFTVAFWFKSASNPENIILGQTSGGNNWDMLNANSGHWYVRSAGSDLLSNVAPMNNDTWNRYVWTRRGSTSMAFVNGNNIVNASDSVNYNAVTNFQIGSSSGTMSIDDLIIYTNYSWTNGEILFDYNNGTGREMDTNVIASLSITGVTIAPTNGSAFVPYQNYSFNATIVNSNYSTGLSFDNINYSLTNVSNSYSKVFTNLNASTYSYYFWAYNSTGGYNQTTLSYYTITKATPALSISISPTTLVPIGTNVTVNASGCPDGSCILKRNGTIISNPDVGNFSLGTYVYNYSFSSTNNYFATNSLATLQVVPVTIAGSNGSIIFTNSSNFTNILNFNVPYHFITRAYMNLTGNVNITPVSGLVLVDNFTTLNINLTTPRNIWGNGTNLFIMDEATQSIIRTNLSGSLLEIINISQGDGILPYAPYGLTGNATSLWFTDGAGNDPGAYMINYTGNNATESYTVPSGIYGLLGLARFNSTLFYITSNNHDRVYLANSSFSALGGGTYNTSNGFSTAAFGSDSPLGITTNGTNLWIVDNTDRALYQTDLLGNLIGITNLSQVANSTTPIGVFTNGTDFWITDTSTYQVYHLTNQITSYIISYPSNVNVSQETHQIFYANGTFNATTNRTSNFNTTITNYINTCTYIAGICSIPITFRSATAGILQYDNVIIDNDGFIETGQEYNSSTLETSLENFKLNLSYDSSAFVLAGTLYYNNTAYPATASTTGFNGTLTTSISIPHVVGSTNKSFYWTVALTNSTGTFYFNSSINQQTIGNITLYMCNPAETGKTALNFTTYNDATFNVTNASIDLALNYFVSSQDGLVLNWSSTGEVINNFNICISPPTATLMITGVVSYYRNDSDRRDYFFNNALISNLTQKIPLYLATTATTDIVTYTVLDQNSNPIPSATIYMQKWVIGQDVYINLGMFTTDDNGQGFFNNNLYNTWYRQLVYYNGVLYLTTPAAKIGSTSVTLRINLVGTNPYINYNEGIFSDMSFNNNTNNALFTWSSSTGSIDTGNINIYSMKANSTILIYNTSLVSNSNSLLYHLTENGTYLLVGCTQLNANYSAVPVCKDSLLINIGTPTKFLIMGRTGTVISMMLILFGGILGVALESIIFGILGIFSAFIVSSLLGWLNLGSWIMTLVALIILILFSLRRRVG
jgi:hypothetical protein